MTKVKTIIAFFIFLSGFLFIGESYTFFLENFQEKYVQVGYYLETGDSEEEMRTTILEKANEFNANVFTISKKDGGAFSREITIYGDETIQNMMKKDWGIEPGTISSFFSGKTTFIFKPFEEATEKELQNCWYIGQSPEYLDKMLFPDMVQYSGNFRNDPMPEVSENVVATVWLLMTITIILLTYYDTIYSKKEQMVRIVFGSDSNRLKIKKITSDTIGYSIAATAALTLLLPFTNSYFRWNVSIIGLLALLVGNAIVITIGMRIGQHFQIKSIASTKKALHFSIAIKGFISILTILILSVTLSLSIEGVKLYTQKNYYSSQMDRIHVDISYPYEYEKMEDPPNGQFENKIPLNTSDQLKDNFMRYSYLELDFSLMSYNSFENVSPKWGDRYVFANLSGLKPYNEMIPAWETINKKEGNYILIPEDANQSEIIEEIMGVSNLLGLNNQNLEGVFTYKEGLSVIAEGYLDDEFDYSYNIKNPIIILDTYNYGALPLYPVSYQLKEAEDLDGIIANDFYFLSQFVSLKNEKEKLSEFTQAISGEAINPSLIEFNIIDIGDWYDGLWALQNRSLLIAIILTLLTLILEVQISSLSLRIAYESNARELTIKKVMGYTLVERFKSFFLLTCGICGLSLVGALFFKVFLGIGMLGYLAWGSIIVFLLDVSILVYLTRKNDNLQIQRVLKGGI
ncbi:hypothetical protein [Psychrobacillus sp. NPDC096623]|uniref:hypothetical protein n=1 Tax=Psychrobacillus sp. NPDC096623 TaxID=3364492 RepID=UPI0037FE0015